MKVQITYDESDIQEFRWIISEIHKPETDIEYSDEELLSLLNCVPDYEMGCIVQYGINDTEVAGRICDYFGYKHKEKITPEIIKKEREPKPLPKIKIPDDKEQYYRRHWTLRPYGTSFDNNFDDENIEIPDFSISIKDI